MIWEILLVCLLGFLGGLVVGIVPAIPKILEVRRIEREIKGFEK